MGIRFYDEAIVNKIQKWIIDPNMVILKPNEVSRLWQVRADQTNDKPLTLPLIAISRQSQVNIGTPTRCSLSCSGVNVQQSQQSTITLNAIPVTISYQLDIYTRSYEAGDEYLRNFIFNLTNQPRMIIDIPYNGINIQHVCNLRLQNGATDNSDIGEKLFPDQFTRWTLNIDVNDAYLFSAPVKENAQIYVEDSLLEVKERDIDSSVIEPLSEVISD